MDESSASCSARSSRRSCVQVKEGGGSIPEGSTTKRHQGY
jgi:hypothetical protein